MCGRCGSVITAAAVRSLGKSRNEGYYQAYYQNAKRADKSFHHILHFSSAQQIYASIDE